MNVVVLILHGVTWWRIHERTPATFRFKHRPGWAVVNPLLYPKLISDASNNERYRVFGGPVDDPESAVICTSLLCLGTPLTGSGDDLNTFLFNEAPKLLSQLRFISKFAQFPTSWQSAHVVKLEPSEVQDASVPANREVGGISGFNIDAALTVAKVEALVDLAKEYEPPIYGRLLLDAILAHAAGDYRESILYTALAAETMAAEKLDEAYRRIMGQKHAPLELRIVELPNSSGARERLDPVYEALRNGPRNQMRRSLHELPLYLLGRSLLVDDKALYDSILRIYQQRSSIVHSGGYEIDETQFSSFTANHANVADGIRDVTRLLAWYGDPDPYPILNVPVVLGSTQSRGVEVP